MAIKPFLICRYQVTQSFYSKGDGCIAVVDSG